MVGILSGIRPDLYVVGEERNGSPDINPKEKGTFRKVGRYLTYKNRRTLRRQLRDQRLDYHYPPSREPSTNLVLPPRE